MDTPWTWFAIWIVVSLAVAAGALSVFKRNRQAEDWDDVQIPLEPHEVVVEEPASAALPDLVSAFEAISLPGRRTQEFEPKPPDLVAAAASEWTRPRSLNGSSHDAPPRTAKGDIPWTAEPPKVAGAYWFTAGLSSRVDHCVVVQYGVQLCVRSRGRGGTTFRAVETLDRWWAGPLPLPQFVALDQLEDQMEAHPA